MPRATRLPLCDGLWAAPRRSMSLVAAPRAKQMHSHFLTGSAEPGQQQLVLILLNWTLPKATLQYWQAGHSLQPALSLSAPETVQSSLATQVSTHKH